jgi:hypothetical protein
MNARLKLLLLASLGLTALVCSACGSGGQELQAAVSPDTLVNRVATAQPAAQQPAPEAARRAFTPVVHAGDGLELADESVSEKNEKQRYEIVLTFPRLKGRPTPNAVRFNRAVRATVAREVRRFKDAYGDPAEDDPSMDEKMWGDVYNFLRGGCEIIHLADDFASLRFDLYTYGRGAAHSIHSYVVLNVDLKSGRALTLEELFKPGARYLQALAAHSVSDLKKQYGEEHRRAVERAAGEGLPASYAGVSVRDSEVQTGAGPEAENYRAWNLAAEGVVVSFAACHVGGCADGAKEVVVPYSSLAAILKEDGPAARLRAQRRR